MNTNRQIRNKALLAMKAVTAGALLFAGVACSTDSEEGTETGWNIEEENDVSGDIGNDTDQDVAQLCDDQSSTGECDDSCTMNNDIDCCQQGGGCWDSGNCWQDGCAVPGPFSPPRMAA